MWTNSAFDIVLKTPEDKERFYTFYKNNEELLDYVVLAFKEKIKTSELATDSKDLYGSPNWAYEQADQVGYRRGLREVVKLLSIKEKTIVE